MSGLFEDDQQLDAPPPPDGPGLFGDTPSEPVLAAPYRVLARKYRPTSFNDLIGQEAMVRILRNAFAIGRVAHAFMLTGVRGVGRTTTARMAPVGRPRTPAASAPIAWRSSPIDIRT